MRENASKRIIEDCMARRLAAGKAATALLRPRDASLFFNKRKRITAGAKNDAVLDEKDTLPSVAA